MEEDKEKTIKEEFKIAEKEVLNYKDVAKRVGVPRSWKAVGNLLKSKREPRGLDSRFRGNDK